jgi:ribonucleoside-diphosphate reductase alpha chain
MGFAEALMVLGVSYASEDAIVWADRFVTFIADEARRASRELAAARGVFPNWDASVHAAAGDRLRNATLLSIAPTGTLSLIAATTAGIEPLFALAYRRAHSLGGEPLAEINPIFVRHMRAYAPDAERLLGAILEWGRLHDVPDVPDEIRRRFATATEVPPGQHLRIQQAFQRRVDNAVSKTVNLPEDASATDVGDVYRAAWRLGLKGVTVFRCGSRDSQVLMLGVGEDAATREAFTKCDPGACRL